MPSDRESTARAGLRARVGAFLSRRSQFSRNIAKISVGQVLRTAIGFAAIPIVARLYAAEDFGNLQLVVSMMSTFGMVGCLKYEMAIVLADDTAERHQVNALCFLVLSGVVLLVAAILLLAGGQILEFFRAGHLESWALFVALGAGMGGLTRITQFNLIATQQFGALSRNNVLQVATGQGLSILWGLVHPSFVALFLSRMIGSALAIVRALWLAPPQLRGVRGADVRRVAHKFRKFPMVNTIGVFANGMAVELPVFMLARFFEAEVVGYYMLTVRLLEQPMVLVGGAVAQVYLQSAADAHRRDPRELFALYKSAVRRLATIGLIPVFTVLLLAGPVIPWLLGSEWTRVADFMQIVVFFKYLEFITTPVGTSFSVVNRQEIGVVLMVVSAGVRFAAMLYWSATPESMLIALVISGGLYQVLYNAAIHALLARRARDAAALESTATPS